MTGKECLELARTKIGCKYILGTIAAKDNIEAKVFDCAEFIAWDIYQVSGRLYGCSDNEAEPKTADAWTNFFKRDAKELGKIITVEEAKGIAGAILLRYTTGTKMGHIAFSDGEAGTVEAHSTNKGVIEFTAEGRRWDTGILIPWISYGAINPVSISRQAIRIYHLTSPMMKDVRIGMLQRALNIKDDNWYGEDTMNAVADYQRSKGLLIDGEAGREVFQSLGI